MITKKLSDLSQEINNYHNELNKCENKEEEEKLTKIYLNSLKLYLYEANLIIKETFQAEISPFKTGQGYNASYTNNINTLNKKTKTEFLTDIDLLTNSSIYINLNSDQKDLIDKAFYVLKTYYENTLI